MADNLRNSTKLAKGKAIGAQKGLVDTFNEIVDVLNRLEVDTPLKLDKLPFGKWVIGLESSQGGSGDMLLDGVSIHKRTLTGTDPQPVQLLNFDSPSGTTMQIPEPEDDTKTMLDGMDDFHLITRRVNPLTGVASLAYIDKAGLAKILGAKEELIPIIAETTDGGFTLTAKKVLVFHSEAIETPVSHTFEKSILVTSLDMNGNTLTATFKKSVLADTEEYSINPILTIGSGGSVDYVGGGGEHYSPGNNGWTGGTDGEEGDGSGSSIGTPGEKPGTCDDAFPGEGGGGGDDGYSPFPSDPSDRFPGKEFKCW